MFIYIYSPVFPGCQRIMDIYRDRLERPGIQSLFWWTWPELNQLSLYCQMKRIPDPAQGTSIFFIVKLLSLY
jgi:hypothetical protein